MLVLSKGYFFTSLCWLSYALYALVFFIVNMDSVRLLAFAVFYIAALVQGSDIKYSTVTGYFLQDEPSTDATTFDYVRPPMMISF